MDVSVIVGPGREQPSASSIPSLFLHYLPLLFVFSNPPAQMSPATSSKETFKAVVFKGRNPSKYKLMEIQEDPFG